MQRTLWDDCFPRRYFQIVNKFKSTNSNRVHPRPDVILAINYYQWNRWNRINVSYALVFELIHETPIN